MCHSAFASNGYLVPDRPSKLSIKRPGGSSQFAMKAGVGGIHTPRILFIDAYDSFSNNIIALLRESLTTVEQTPIIEKITIDHAPYWPPSEQSRDLFVSFVSGFDAVVAGPGPGTPSNAQDVGLFNYLWSLPEAHQLPVLGICLGFQSMCLDAGASVVRLPQGRHGIVTDLNHCNKSIFTGIGRLQATHYHSLHVNIDHPIQTGLGFHASAQLWQASLGLPRITPLAWDCSPPSAQGHADTQRTGPNVRHNGAILMAARIEDRPWWGVQYHPESICSGKDEAVLLLTNWWRDARTWLQSRPSDTHSDADCLAITEDDSTAKRRHRGSSSSSDRPTKRLQHEAPIDCGVFATSSAVPPPKRDIWSTGDLGEPDSDEDEDPPDADEEDPDYAECEDTGGHVDIKAVPSWFGGFRYSPKVLYEKVFVEEAARERTVQHVRDLVGAGVHECVVYEAGQSSVPQSTGRFSIVGLVDEDSLKICYFSVGRTVRVFRGADVEPIFVASDVDFAAYWRRFKQHFRAEGGDDVCPAWGPTFLSYSYEACLDTIGATADETVHGLNDWFMTGGRPDVFAVVALRSIVIDHFYHDAWVQSVAPNDEEWVLQATEALSNGFADTLLHYHLDSREADIDYQLKSEAQMAECRPSGPQPEGDATLIHGGVYAGPSRGDYERKVRKCQEHIAAGDSYELCLTGKTSIKLPRTRYPRSRDDLLYRNLTEHNPAPFGARIQLTLGPTGVTIFSSSPERFLRWDRGKKCEFRPIKGTLRKTKGMTKEDAREYFTSTKERAENLMITDLIRHDLYGVLQQPDSVRVPPSKLFAVEEYSTVFQLVTAVEGRFRNTDKTGVDVFNASLPPGSMTGAPKKRSCELLQEIEDHQPRGLYSGVIGYDDVGGGGDFSVLIRAAVRWDDDVVREQDQDGNIHEFERWTIGAGGAVTGLSDPTAEYNEMITKRNAVLQAFVNLPGGARPQS